MDQEHQEEVFIFREDILEIESGEDDDFLRGIRFGSPIYFESCPTIPELFDLSKEIPKPEAETPVPSPTTSNPSRQNRRKQLLPSACVEAEEAPEFKPVIVKILQPRVPDPTPSPKGKGKGADGRKWKKDPRQKVYMHQLDIKKHPEAKDAKMSRASRERKKKEVEDLKREVDALKYANFGLVRDNYVKRLENDALNSLLTQYFRADVVKELKGWIQEQKHQWLKKEFEQEMKAKEISNAFSEAKRRN